MKIKLNLLPEKRKKVLTQKKRLRFIVWQEIWLICGLLVFFGTAIGVKKVLLIRMNSLESAIQTTEIKKEQAELTRYENTFVRTNQRVNKILKIQNNNIDWTKSLREFSEIVPIEIVLKSLATEDLLITIEGQAKERKDLIALKEKIEKSNCFSAPDIPLNDIVAKKDIEFQMSFVVKKKCVKTYEKGSN